MTILGALCLLYSQNAVPINLPGWFWDTPIVKNESFAVGYSTVYHNLESSFEIAFDNASWQLFQDQECNIIGERAYIRVPDGVLSMGGVFKVLVDSASFESFKKTIYHIDSTVTADLVLALVGTKQIGAMRKLIPSPRIRDPDYYLKEETIVGMGISPQYHYETSSWEEAERNARIELAFSSDASIRSLEASIPPHDVQTTVVSTDVVLREIQSVARAIDPVTNVRIIVVRSHAD